MSTVTKEVSLISSRVNNKNCSEYLNTEPSLNKVHGYRLWAINLTSFCPMLEGLLALWLAWSSSWAHTHKKLTNSAWPRKSWIKTKKKKSLPLPSMPFTLYPPTYLKSFLDWINVNPSWAKVQNYIEACDLNNMQIDITYIIKKLILIDAAMSKLL